MALPTLSPTQVFNKTVAQGSQALATLFSQGGIQGVYAQIYNNWFANPNGDSAAAIAALGTTGANQLNALQSLYTYLTAQGVTGLTAIPAYTVNQDGSATLV